jgi:hypothetical protein
VGLERGPLSLGSTIEELLERKNSGSGLENCDYGLRDPHAQQWVVDQSKIEIIIQFNSIIYYLCAESTATEPITDTAQ